MEQAVDKGGPTRQFLSRVWRELGELAISNGTDEIKLFKLVSSEDRSCLVPAEDGTLKGHEEQARMYYRAIGKLLGFCLVHGFRISDHLLPELYRKALFFGVRPESDTLSDAQLLRDLMQLGLPENCSQWYEGRGIMRREMQDMYIDSRRIFIEGASAGIMFRGRYMAIIDSFCNLDRKPYFLVSSTIPQTKSQNPLNTK